MTQSLETIRTDAGIEYQHDDLGLIGTKVYQPSGYWGFVPADGQPAALAKQIFGQTSAIWNSETVDWLALALAAELIGLRGF